MQNIAGKLRSIQVGQPVTLDAPAADLKPLPEPCERVPAAEKADVPLKPWTTGIFKQPIDGPVRLGWTNLAGDQQADLKVHGGPDKAVCVYSAAHYTYWRETLQIADFSFGAFGENFTVDGLDESNVCIGDTFRIGDTVVEVSQPRQPCWKLARRWQLKDLAVQVQQTGLTGWYFRVMQEGTVAAGMPIQLENSPHPTWTLARANQVMHHDKTDFSSAATLAAIPHLSASWRSTLENRVARGCE